MLLKTSYRRATGLCKVFRQVRVEPSEGFLVKVMIHVNPAPFSGLVTVLMEGRAMLALYKCMLTVLSGRLTVLELFVAF